MDNQNRGTTREYTFLLHVLHFVAIHDLDGNFLASQRMGGRFHFAEGSKPHCFA